MLKNGVLFLFIIFLGNLPLYGQESDSLLSLDALLEEAQNNNPQLQAFRYQALADSLKIPQAGALPDPMVSLNMLNLPLDNFVFDQEPMSGKQIALKQTFPFFGKLALKEKVARKNARVTQENYNELRSLLYRNIKQVYYDLFYTDEAITTTKKNYALIEEFVHIAEKKYGVGKGLQQDVLKAQVELSKMNKRLIVLKQKREQLESGLNKLLNRPARQTVARTTKPALPVKQYKWDHLEKTTREQRALLKAWRLRIEQRKAQSALARKSYLPDFSVFMAYTQRDVLQSGMGGVDFLSAGVTFNLPLYFWKKQDKQVQEKKIVQKQAEAAYLNIQNEVNAELNNTLSALEKNTKLLELYGTGIIPQAAQALQSAMIGYQTDKVDFLTLINNQKTMFNFELEYAGILSAYQKNLAELEYVTGTNIQ